MINLAIGIDIGGTNTAIGIIDREGKIYYQSSIPTQTRAKVEDYVFDICQEIERGKKTIKQDFEIKGIGIGAPNANYYKGTIDDAPNLRWRGTIEFAALFLNHCNTPVFLTNDANAAALGEMIYGGAKKMENFAVVTLGTGLGSGIVVNGKLMYGYNGHAGELGHVIVDHNGRNCNCGRKGCLETYVSATGLVRTVFDLLAHYTEPSELRDIPYSKLTAKMVADAAKNNDFIALKVFKKTAEILGKSLANLTAITGNEAIFLFGGVTKAGSILFDQVKYYMNKNMLSVYNNSIKLLQSELGDNAAILGSSALVWSELE